MPIVTGRNNVLDLYEENLSKQRVMPCICTENLTTIEAVLEAVRLHGEKLSEPNLPISIAITNLYKDRAQSVNYTHTRQWDIGLKLFLAELKVLTDPGSPFEDIRVLVHLDHTQYDEALVHWNMKQFSSIMLDASKLPLEENIARTRNFVEEKGKDIVVEGACDEIVEADSGLDNPLTTADQAEKYVSATGADMIVANLGTEHRASTSSLKYHPERAREIKQKIGSKLVLHGASSVEKDQIANLAEDGVCKVNLWTALERDASPLLFNDMVKHATQVAGAAAVENLIKQGFLSEQCRIEGKASIDYFATVYRQTIVFKKMTEMVGSYLDNWYR